MPDDSGQFVALYQRALEQVAESFEQLMKTWRARQQTIGQRLEKSPFAEVSTVTQGFDYAGERIPHTVDSLVGGVGVDQITSMVRDHISWIKARGIKTDLDEIGEMELSQQHAADAPLWAFMEARAISEKSIVPPVWHEQLLNLEKVTEEPGQAEERKEKLKRRFLSFQKKQAE